MKHVRINLHTVLEALAIHFGWSDWNEYVANNDVIQTRELKQKVYDMPFGEKKTVLENIYGPITLIK